MLRYGQYLIEAAKKKKKPHIMTGVETNTNGVMHELLTGYHLRGGKHMLRHNNDRGESPKQAHDRLKATGRIGGKPLSPEQYKEMHKRGKAAANDLKKHFGKKAIKKIHWTSKDGDMKSSTGIDATQTQDASDIVVHHGKSMTGVSLKVSHKKAKVPISNPGLESSYGAGQHLDKHREQIHKHFPHLKNMTVKKREEWLKDHAKPKEKAKIKEMNNDVLMKMGKHLHNELKKKTHREVINHIRQHVLKAFKTPMEKANKGEHIRHTTMGIGKHTHSNHRPSEDHEHILSDPKKINFQVDHNGHGVAFTHKGKVFARHRFKFNSQSNPLSGIKATGGET
jgi:hypothetical protein